MWRVRLVGQPSVVSLDGEVVHLNLKDAALVALAALEPQISVARAAAMLWPEADRRGSLNNLRQRLFRLKRAVRMAFFEHGETLKLHTNIKTDCLCDLSQLAHDVHAADGDVLGDFDYSGVGESLVVWVESKRDAWRSLRNTRLHEFASTLSQRREHEAAIRYAQHLAHLDPLSESAHRLLMEVHYMRGDRAAAIAAYERCEALLRRELHVAPDEPTLQLLCAIESMQLPATLERTPAPTVALRRPPQLVGRKDALEALSRAWQSGRHFILVGEAGLGKTRLLEEFASIYPPLDVCMAVAGDHRMPYALLARLWGTQLAPRLDDASRSLSARELALLGQINPLAPKLSPAADQAPNIQPGLLRAALLAAFRSIGKTVERRLLLDDLHFADAASCEMLHTLLPHLRELGWHVGMAHRPGDALGGDTAWLSALVEQGHAQRHVLAPLTQQHVLALIQTLGFDGRDHELDATMLFKRCGGNPFFMLETLRGWLDSERQGATSREQPRAAQVDAMLDDRLARLSPEARTLAQVACVAGADMHVELAASVLERPAAALAEPWHELERADVMHEERFVHDLVREAVGRSLPQPVRKALCGRAAAWLANQHTPAARLADLWRQAARWREAADASEAAAHHAENMGRLAEALSFLEQAADCWQRFDDVARRNRALAACAATLEELGRYAQAREVALRLIKEATGLHDRAAGIAALATLRYDEVADDETLRLAREAKGLAVALGDCVLERRMAALEGHTLCWMGRPAEGLEVTTPFAAVAMQRAEDAATLDFLGWHIDVLRFNGQAQEALDLLSKQRLQATAPPPFSWRTSALFTEAELAYDQAWLERSVVCLEQLRDLRCGASGELDGVTQEDCLFVERLALIGRFREALDIGHRALAAYRDQGNPWLVGATQVALSLTYSKLGQGARALAVMSDLSTDDPGLQMRWQVAVGAACETLERPAAPHFTRALALAPQCEVPTEAAWLIESMLLPHLAAQEAADRADALWSAVRSGQRLKYVLPVRVSVMETLRRVGRSNEAAEHARALLQVFSQTHAASFAAARTWWLIYTALASIDGCSEQAQHALKSGRAWLERVLPNVPADFRERFTGGLFIHRRLLARSE